MYQAILAGVQALANKNAQNQQTAQSLSQNLGGVPTKSWDGLDEAELQKMTQPENDDFGGF
jgi:hypothetical protein